MLLCYIIREMVHNTTPTEEALGMSLPASLRDLSVEEVEAQQSIPTRFRTFSGGGGGTTTTTTTTPTPPVSQEPILIETTLTPKEQQQGLTLPEKVAILRRERIKQQALERGRGFTRLTVERKLGGGRGVRELRRGRRRGFRAVRRPVPKPEEQAVPSAPLQSLRLTEREKFRRQSLPFEIREIQVTPREQIEARMLLPPRERIKFAFRSAGKGAEVRGGIRAGLEIVSIGAEKLRIDVSGPIVSSRFIEDVIILSAFSPASITSTTAVIERAMTPTLVSFAGVQQVIKGDIILTRTAFQTVRAGEFQKGVALATTRFATVEGGVVFTTVGKGVTFTRTIKFPSAVTSLRINRRFISGEVGLAKQVGRVVIQRGIGGFRTTSEKALTKFLSESVSATRGQTTGSIGIIRSRLGDAFSLGVTRRVPPTMQSFDIVTGAGGRPATIFKAGVPRAAVAEQSVKSIVQAGLAKKPPTFSIPKVPIVPKVVTEVIRPAGVTIQPVTTTRQRSAVTSTAQTSREIQRAMTIPRVEQVVASVSKTALRTDTTTRSRQALRTEQRTKVIQRADTAQRLRLLQAPRQVTRQKTAQRFRSVFPRPPLPRPPTTPKLVPFGFLRGRAPSPQRAGGISVFLRRFGKFRPIATGVTREQAFAIGRRAVGTTLGATFKVPGVRQPSKIPGFRTKKTKEGTLFIELPKFRLSTPTELKEIQAFRRRI